MYDILQKYVNELVHDHIENRNSMSTTERDINYGRILGVLDAITICIQEEILKNNKEELSNE